MVYFALIMSHFNWALHSTLRSKLYTEQDYHAAKAKAKTYRRSKPQSTTTHIIHWTKCCNCTALKNSFLQIPHDHDSSVSMLRFPLNRDPPVSMLPSPQDHDSPDLMVQSPQRRDSPVSMLQSPHDPDPPVSMLHGQQAHNSSLSEHCSEDAGVSGGAEMTHSIPISGVEEMASTCETQQLEKQAWTSKLDSQLLHLKEDAQLTWDEILMYFPARTKTSISQHYFRLKHQDPPKLGRQHTLKHVSQSKSRRSDRQIPTRLPKSQKVTKSSKVRAYTTTTASTKLLQPEKSRVSKSGRKILNPFRNRQLEGYALR